MAGWNNLLFLWGVYRGRRVNYSSESPIVRNNICIFSRNGRQNQKQESCDFPVSATQNICSCAESSKSLSASVTSSREQQGPKSFALLGQLSPERKAETTGSKISDTGHKDINSQTSLACQRTSINYAKNHLSRDAPHIVSFEVTFFQFCNHTYRKLISRLSCICSSCREKKITREDR